MKPFQFLALLCAFTLPVFAETTPKVTPATEGAPAPGTLKVARAGSVVVLTWTLPLTWSQPEFEIRTFEIVRNTSESTKGRGRLVALRSTVSTYTDVVPDTSANYWYWLKATFASGEIVNIGPVGTPPIQP
jgi:hypothetical protein